jgi:uncharacterized protein
VQSRFPQPELEPLSRMQVLSAMGITAILLWVIAKVWQQLDPIPQIPLQWNIQALGLGATLGCGITAGSALIYQLWPRYRLAADSYLEMILRPLEWPDLLWLGLLPGLSEELLFRGVMFPAFGLNWGGILLSSVCFGVLHLSSWNQWPYAIWATVVGGFLAYSVLGAENLLVPVVAHVVTNLLASATWKWLHRFPTPSVKS